ncbi:zinc dependent phospholipase C family protein [Roseateles sp. NT4]|uniref:zinc dependent phospholipase C family protein n=1 Tax=Roseateles sp. NT4 TaxID=3453715 RepID=UPI003EEA83CB
MSKLPRVRRLAASIFLGLCASTSALAFKVDTHVFIAQKLINELEVSDKLVFSIGGIAKTATVDPGLRKAILENREAFALGAIGPDAFPGIYEGQMTIHPGGKNGGWGTGEWLMQLVKHASTDAERAFAFGMLVHAASDIFAHTYVNKYSGDVYLLTDEIDVERRHFLIESYISTKLPPLTKPNGQPMPGASAQITVDGVLRPPGALLRRAWLEDPDASKQWAANGAPHFRAIYALREQLATSAGTGGATASFRQASRDALVRYKDELNDKEWNLKAADVLAAEQGRAARGSREDVRAFKSRVLELATESKVDASSIILDAPIRGGSKSDLLDEANVLRRDIDDLASVKSETVDAAANVLANLRDYLRKQIAQLKSVVKTLGEFTREDGAEALLKDWLVGLDSAMDAYYVANGLAIRNAMDHKDPLPPLQHWASCDSGKILGVPPAIADSSCAVKDVVASLRADLERLEEAIADDVPLYRHFLKFKSEIERVMADAAKKELLDRSGAARYVNDLVTLITQKPTPADIDQEFARVTQRKALLVIDSASKRLDADMHLDANGMLDPEKFAPMRNALVLSRLALLPPDQVNRLVDAPLLDASDARRRNVLFTFAHSIDGDHQWLPFSPPYVRREGDHKCAASYGYGASPLWTPREGGARLFAALFTGPLAPGLETPTAVGLQPVLPQSYRYVVTATEPFPEWTEAMNQGACSTSVK